MGLTPENISASDCFNWTQTQVNIFKAISLGVIFGGLILFGVLGNIVVILSVACHKHLQSVTHYYIINLAVADLLLTSTVLPFSAIYEILDCWVFGRIFCNIWAAVDVLCCTASIMSLCVISIDRYIGMSYPLRYPAIVTEKRGLLALVCVWALSLIISIGPLFGWRQPAPKDEKICKINTDPGYVLFSALGSFYLPMVIILVMYCRVYVVARRESKGLSCGLKTEKSHSEEVTLRIHCRNNTEAAGATPTTKNKSNFSIRLLKFSREKKAAKSLGIVVGCFILCWLPFFLIMPIGSFFPDRPPPEVLFKIAFWLGYLNSCINPIIYPCSSQEFKKAFQNILRAQCLHRRYAANKYSLSWTLNHPSHRVPEAPKDIVRIPVGSGEHFYKISKSDGVCEWKLFSAMQSMSTKSNAQKERSSCSSAKVKSKGFLRECCCANTSEEDPKEHPIPTIKIHTVSISENGEEV
ncbi:alpha-1A adrenergic receptor [Erythrolamprus reginae]|uniref:alpha-1A adrenergic receptor n=1 Tax=Erythrolamprus reginae TaxID=121349 RepID=UPI00396C96BE